ncbi:MAG: rhamnan synthesis F family protein [Pseudomonas sp.]
MNARIRTLLRAASRSVEAHGGGVRGLVNVLVRTCKVIRALGLPGFLRRVRSAGRPATAVALSEHTDFNTPAALEDMHLRVGVMAHIFYPDLIDEFADYLARIPVRFVLLVSVIDDAAGERARIRFSSLANIRELHVRVVPNRGRDIAPLLATFREAVLALDVIGHVHTKKSLYAGSEQRGWRHYLLDSLLGDRQRIAHHLGLFQSNETLGILYPESYAGVPGWAHTWLSNLEVCRELGNRLDIAVEAGRYLDFPAGSMFWARVQALRPLYALELRIEDFPEERGQTDGTLQHAVERMLVAVVRRHGYVAAIVPPAADAPPAAEGLRNWPTGLDTALATRIRIAAINAAQISTDIFDTLVVRPFLTPQGARAYLGHCAQRMFGASGFAELRERAEAKARSQAGRDVDLDAIYTALASLPAAMALPLDRLKALELALERRHLRPRQSVVEALSALPRTRPLLALSDMYFDAASLRQLLPAAVAALPDAWHVSCETGLRKDQDALWSSLPGTLAVAPERWLHIGDNEHADIQLPQKHGLATPVHVPRPSALLDLHPALRPLRPLRFDQASWSDQLWLGLVANRFADAFDRAPDASLPRPSLDPESLGYTMLGPLLADYLAWLGRCAGERPVEAALFLSREGYLLERGFALMQQAGPGFARLQAHYLPTSRRASGMASLREPGDLPRLLTGTYNGTLDGLLRARLGEDAAAAVGTAIGRHALADEFYLPEMQEALHAALAPALPALIAVAAREREAYLAYWERTLGTAPAMVADIGYSGSIQASLARMLARPLDGGYLALSKRARQGLEGQWAAARHHDGRSDLPDAQSLILRHDLLLETLLTAPHPQFTHFEMATPAPLARYNPPELDAMQLDLIARVHEGALEFIRDICHAIGEDVEAFDPDPDLVQRPLHCVGSGLWAAPWLGALSVDDAFTGRGRVSPG